MKKKGFLIFVLIFLVLFISVSLVSASWFSDFFNNFSGKITGNAFTQWSCTNNYIGDYENWLYAKIGCEDCIHEGGRCYDIYKSCMDKCIPSTCGNCWYSAQAASFFYARNPYMEQVCIVQEPGQPEECHDEVTRPAGFFNCLDGLSCPSGTKRETNCSNNIDEDADGLIDCKDGDCKYDANCIGCPSGQTKCSGVCVELKSDINNCGSCGKKCLADEYCENGICKLKECKNASGNNLPDCTSCGNNKYCLKGDCIEDKDKDGFIPGGVIGQASCFGDCDDNLEDDSEICKENPEMSFCAKKINPNAIEVCDGVDNNCKGRCEGKAAGGNFGEKECTSSSECNALEVYGPNGAGFCQMVDDDVVVNGQLCLGLSQCVKSGEYTTTDIKESDWNHALSELQKKRIGISYDYSTNQYRYLGELSWQPAITIQERRVYNPASNNKNSECGNSFIFTTAESYFEYEANSLGDDGWQPVTNFAKNKYEKEVIVDNCLPNSEKIIGKNPDSGNMAGFYNYFVENNRDTNFYPSEEIMNEISWTTSCAIKDKCADKLDNDGEEDLINVLSSPPYNIILPTAMLELTRVCCDYTKIGESYKWAWLSSCLWRGGEPITKGYMEELKFCGNPEFTTGKSFQESLKLLAAKQIPYEFIDVDDPDCHASELGYCLDEDNDGFCGCIRPQGTIINIATGEVKDRLAVCDEEKMKISSYDEKGKPIGKLKSNLFPDCDDNLEDDNLPEYEGGYLNENNKKYLASIITNGKITTQPITANLVHPFQQLMINAVIKRYDTAPGCFPGVSYLDINCNKAHTDEASGKGYSLGGIFKNPPISPFDYDRTTGIENYEPGGTSQSDLFCTSESPSAVAMNHFLEVEAVPVGSKFFISVVGIGLAGAGSSLLVAKAGLLGESLVELGGISFTVWQGKKVFIDNGPVETIKAWWDVVSNVATLHPLDAKPESWGYVSDSTLLGISAAGSLSNGIKIVKKYGMFVDYGSGSVASYNGNLFKSFRVQGTSENPIPFASGKLRGILADSSGKHWSSNIESVANEQGGYLRGIFTRNSVASLFGSAKQIPSSLVLRGVAGLPQVTGISAGSSQGLLQEGLWGVNVPILYSGVYQHLGDLAVSNIKALAPENAYISPTGQVLPAEIPPEVKIILTGVQGQGLVLPSGSNVPWPYEQNCFLAGTPVLLANGSYVNIESIKQGDEILSYTSENKITNASVIENFEREVKEYYIINFTYLT